MRLIPTVVAVAVVVGCSDSFAPTTENVVGDYSLQWLLTVNGGQGTNWGQRGATFNLSLAPNGTTSGHLFVPGVDEGGGDFSADMAGTWTLSGDTVRFSQTADSFVRDMAWIVSENRLGGDYTSGDDRVIASVKK
jgi:hypothetical protein